MQKINFFLKTYSFIIALSLILQLFPWLKFQYFFSEINSLIFEGILETNTMIYSDSVGFFLHLILLLVPSVIVYFILNRTEKTSAFLNQALLIILIGFLVIYGLDKLTLHQFPEVESNVLYTKFGNLSKQLVYWSLIGSSPSYQIITGAIELLIAISLLFPKFRSFGLVACIFTFGNILLINICFEIDVIFLSAFLLYLSITLYYSYNEKSFPSNSKMYIISFLIFVIMSIFRNSITDSYENKVYEVLNSESSKDSRFKNGYLLHFTSMGYLIIQNPHKDTFHGIEFRKYQNMENVYYIDNGKIILTQDKLKIIQDRQTIEIKIKKMKKLRLK